MEKELKMSLNATVKVFYTLLKPNKVYTKPSITTKLAKQVSIKASRAAVLLVTFTGFVLVWFFPCIVNS